MDEFFRTLAMRRPHARQLVWRKVRPDDVIHAPSGPLQVVSPPAAVPDTDRLVVTVVDRYGNGEPFERPLQHSALRDVLVSRNAEVPADLQL
jgi:hypothetical protein